MANAKEGSMQEHDRARVKCTYIINVLKCEYIVAMVTILPCQPCRFVINPDHCSNFDQNNLTVTGNCILI